MIRKILFIFLDNLLAQSFPWLIVIFTIFLCIPSVSTPLYFIYFVFDAKMQILLLTDYVISLKIIGNANEFDREIYIKECLKNIIIKHLDVKRYS